MNAVKELEIQLAAAKKEQADSERAAFLMPFLTVTGKCFLYRDPSKRCNVVGFVKYGKDVEMKVCEHRGTYAQLKEDRVFAQSVPSFWYVGNVVQAKKDSSATYSHFHDLSQWHVKEVDAGVFKAAWESVGILAGMMMAKWEADTDTPPLPDMVSEPVGDLDLPHVVLEGMEPSIVGQSCFLIGSRFLVTANSRALAYAKIAEDEAIDARCSHLYEQCDMAYVTWKRAAIASLRRKLTEVR